MAHEDLHPTSEEPGETDYEPDRDEDREDDYHETRADEDRKRQLHEDMIENLRSSLEGFAAQRKWESFWRRFYRALELSDQWDDTVLDARSGIADEGDTGASRRGARPCLMMNEIKQPVQLGVNEARQVRLSLHVKPERGKASEKEAKTREGLLRAIQYHSNATNARMWALENAFICGRGFWRMVKEYANDGDDDLDLAVAAILHQENVHPDPHATQLDMSDASFWIIADEITQQERRRRFPNAKKPTDQQLEALGAYSKEWWNDKTCQVAEGYYVIQHTKVRYVDPEDYQWKDLVGEDEAPRPGIEEEEPTPLYFDHDETDDEIIELLPTDGVRWRRVPVREIRWCLFDAAQILDEEEWEGDWLPVFQTVGRAHVVDGKVIFKGLVADGVAPAQLENYAISNLAELVGTGTKAPWVIDIAQIEGYKDIWDTANTENHPYLPYHRRDEDGNDLGEPRRRMDEPPILAVLQTFQQARELLKAVMGRYGASLGDLTPDRSGKAINALKVAGEMGSSDFLDNLVNIGMPQESRCFNDMLFPVYGEEGRLAKMLGEEEDSEQTVAINAPFVIDPSTKQPMPLPEQSLMARMGQGIRNVGRRMIGQPPVAGPEVQEFRLTKEGKYGVRWVSGPSAPTERLENVELLTNLIEKVKDPNFSRMAVTVMLKNLDSSAAKELLEMLSPPGQDGKPLPPAAQAAIAQMQQERDQAVAAAQEMKAKADGKLLQVQSQERLEMLRMKAEQLLTAAKMRLELEKIAQQTGGKLDVVRLQGAIDQLEQAAEHEHEERMQVRELAAKASMQRSDQAAAAGQQERQIGADREAQDRDAVHKRAQTDTEALHRITDTAQKAQLTAEQKDRDAGHTAAQSDRDATHAARQSDRDAVHSARQTDRDAQHAAEQSDRDATHTARQTDREATHDERTRRATVKDARVDADREAKREKDDKE